MGRRILLKQTQTTCKPKIIVPIIFTIIFLGALFTISGLAIKSVNESYQHVWGYVDGYDIQNVYCHKFPWTSYIMFHVKGDNGQVNMTYNFTINPMVNVSNSNQFKLCGMTKEIVYNESLVKYPIGQVIDVYYQSSLDQSLMMNQLMDHKIILITGLTMAIVGVLGLVVLAIARAAGNDRFEEI
jgi:hypothetical protein